MSPMPSLQPLTTTTFMNDTDSLCTNDWSDFQKNIPVVVVFSLFSVTGTAGNSLVLYIYGSRFKKTTTRIFILSLAFFDLITCASLPYKILLLRYPEWFKDSNRVRLEIVRIYFLQMSALILPLVSIDRYRRICTPLKKQISPKVAKLLVLCISVAMAAINIARMAITSGHCYRAEAYISPDYVKGDVDNSWTNELYFFMGVILPFIIPLPILMIMYLLVGIKVRSMSRQSTSNPPRISDRPRETPPGSLKSTRGLGEKSRVNVNNEDIFCPGPDMDRQQVTLSSVRPRTHVFECLESDIRDELRTRHWRRYSYDEATRCKDSLPHVTGRERPENPNSIFPHGTNQNKNRRAQAAENTFFGDADSRPSTTASPEGTSTDHHNLRTDPTDRNAPRGGNKPNKQSVSDVRVPWKRMTIIFFLITLIYITGCIPFFTIFMIFRVNHDYGRQLLSNGGFIVLYDLVYITVVTNCFLYGFFDPRFQRELKLLKAKLGERLFGGYRICDGDVCHNSK